MIEQVEKRYPNRSDWIQMGSLPHIPSFSDTFDMVSALAVLQHVPRSELFLSLFNIKQILKPKGFFVFSLPLNRDDLNEDARDKEGRLHYPYIMNEICLLLEQLGFQFVKEINLPDDGAKGKRKQGQLREFFLEQSDLSCIWTGKSLHSGNFVVNRGIPYSYWENNFLWNLFPMDAKTNRLKSDKIPSANLLSKRELQIREHWNKLSQSKPNQFTFEIKNYLGKYYQAKDWDVTLIAMFQETAETLASRRGIMRWDGE
ncbi:methyltransferase domain-containing protein [Leptospira levettii]|nr:methyltransferase domain-containing protein [Leptospira levettii]